MPFPPKVISTDSMENLADISEPLVPSKEEKDQ